jgi:hypothetical protein
MSNNKKTGLDQLLGDVYHPLIRSPFSLFCCLQRGSRLFTIVGNLFFGSESEAVPRIRGQIFIAHFRHESRSQEHGEKIVARKFVVDQVPIRRNFTSYEYAAKTTSNWQSYLILAIYCWSTCTASPKFYKSTSYNCVPKLQSYLNLAIWLTVNQRVL